MVRNLLQNGTPFSYSVDDSNYSDDLLNLEIEPDTIEVSDETDPDMEFEDETSG